MRDADDTIRSVSVSAKTGAGIDLLRETLAVYFQDRNCSGWIKLSPAEGRQRALLYQHGQIITEQTNTDGGCLLHVSIDRRQLQSLGISVERISHETANGPVVVAGAA
jgi:GTP-binding protein HflX